MGSHKGKLPPAAHDPSELDPDQLAMDMELRRCRSRGGYGAMRVREAAVMPFAARADEDYPALVEGILGHVFRVLRELDEQQVDIMILRDDTRVALERLKAA
ncbi:MAG TPA: hypothetical protein VFR37_05710 [Longimicrobium sp.]|nr:hypothetical protein [Longimicrobium sp.]